MRPVLERTRPELVLLRQDEYESLSRGRALEGYAPLRVFEVPAWQTARAEDFQSMYLLRRSDAEPPQDDGGLRVR